MLLRPAINARLSTTDSKSLQRVQTVQFINPLRSFEPLGFVSLDHLHLKEGRRSANRRNVFPCPRHAPRCYHLDALGARGAPQTVCANGANQLLSGRARLPALRRGTRQGLHLLTQLQARLPGTWLRAGVTRPRLSQSSGSTPRTGRNAGEHDAQSRPGAGCIFPPAGTALAPLSGVPSAEGVPR